MIYIKKFNENFTNNKQKWDIYAGLGGGYGGANFIKTFVGTKEDAEREAYQYAIEEYDSYLGNGDLRSVEDIMEQDSLDVGEALQSFQDERESWLDYYVNPHDPNNKIK